MDDYLHDKVAREVHSGVARCRDYIEVSTFEADKARYNTILAQFPEKLARLAGTIVVSPGDGLVLDPFLGNSGTTALAARQQQRTCIGVETNPAYVAVATQRLKETVPGDTCIRFER